MTRVTLLYFASLRDAAGTDMETVETSARDLSTLYAEVSARHGIDWKRDALRVAVNGEFARWSDPLPDGGEVAFIPPVSGG
jgi:molybdopterin synthase sulfur carrier subunit